MSLFDTLRRILRVITVTTLLAIVGAAPNVPSGSAMDPEPFGSTPAQGRLQLRRKQLPLDEHVALTYAHRIVDVQDVNSCPADRSSADEPGPVPKKMFVPGVRAWIEKGNKVTAFGIITRGVCCLRGVAVGTGNAGVLHSVGSVVLACTDVIDLVRQNA